MKQFIFILFVFYFVNSIFSQVSLPILPMKNGLIYYTFTDSISINKKCIKDYLKSKTIDRIDNLFLKESDIRYPKNKKNQSLKDFCELNFNTSSSGINNEKCLEKKTGNFILVFNNSINYIDLTPIGLILKTGKKRVVNFSLTSDFEINFTSKNSYTYTLKKIILYLTYWGGEVKEVELSELYQKLSSENNIKEEDTFIFNELQFWVKKSNEIIKQALSFEIKYDDL
jgi:hypothetical protein